MKGRRILFVTERVTPDTGGLAVASARIARHAQAAGAECLVVAPHHGYAATKAAEVPTLRCNLHNRSDPFMHWTEFTDGIVARFKPHLVHSLYASTAGFVGTTAAKKANVPALVSVRGNDLDRDYYRADRLPYLRQAMSLADVVSGVSQEACDRVQALFGRPAQHITNSIDCEAFSAVDAQVSARIRETLGLTDAFVFGFSGELREKKGLRFLLPAFASVRAKHNVKLLLIGGVRGDDRSHFESFCSKLPNVAPHIVEVPYRRDARHLCAHLSACDALVFPSLREGTPNAMLEAMACERPVLATDAGGHRDLIKHGASGFLLPRHNLDQLAEGLLELCQLPKDVLSQVGRAARQAALDGHQPDAEARAYQRVYDALL